MTTQTAEQLARYLEEHEGVETIRKAAAMLRSHAAEIETLKYNVDTWYERFMEAAKCCHELQALDAAREYLAGPEQLSVHEVWISVDSCNEFWGWEDIDAICCRTKIPTDPSDHRWVYIHTTAPHADLSV